MKFTSTCICNTNNKYPFICINTKKNILQIRGSLIMSLKYKCRSSVLKPIGWMDNKYFTRQDINFFQILVVWKKEHLSIFFCMYKNVNELTLYLLWWKLTILLHYYWVHSPLCSEYSQFIILNQLFFFC